MNDMSAFGRLLEALRPWLDHLVFVGGWCHRLHRFHPSAAPATYLPLMTRDADIALPEGSLGGTDMGEALRRADFKEELSTEFRPPVSKYRLGGDDGGFYAEFLAPLRGGGVHRDGTPDVTVQLAGVVAQKLRHLELLLLEPWTVRVGPEIGIPVDPGVEIRIANPVTFIAHKLLISGKRPRAKRAQDVLYIHDTIELFGARIGELRTLWRDVVRPSLPDKTVRRVEALSVEHFAGVSDVVRAAARIPSDRVLSPERIQQVCAYGLNQVFGEP